MKDTISVIVPIYKVEDYLDKCVSSILNQTYDNLEIILVDDGSPDNCGAMCDGYANRDSRIRVIHKENGGLSDARNAGLAVCTGDYVSFVDSDDYLSPDFYKALLNVIKDNNCDIAECDVKKVFVNDIPDYTPYSEANVNVYDTRQALFMLVNDRVIHQHVWNKLYKRAAVEGELFKKGKTNEDEFWTYRIIGRSNTVAHIDAPLYYYMQRETSIMGVGYSLKRLDALEAYKERQEYLRENYPDIADKTEINLFYGCFYAYKATLKWLKGDEKKQAKKTIKSYMKNINVKKEYLNDTRKIDAIRYRLSKNPVTFGLMSKLESVMGIGF